MTLHRRLVSASFHAREWVIGAYPDRLLQGPKKKYAAAPVHGAAAFLTITPCRH
jgi:hypothetical protein